MFDGHVVFEMGNYFISGGDYVIKNAMKHFKN